jgi:hypothetical protein
MWVIFIDNEYAGGNFTINNNIFLTENGGIMFYKSDDSSNIDYNWFGSNAEWYDDTPEVYRVNPTAWLFLNATASPDALAVSDVSDIIFKLYAYSVDSGISEYGNSLLYPVNLTLTATNGEVFCINADHKIYPNC